MDRARGITAVSTKVAQSGFLLDVPVTSLLPRQVRWDDILPAPTE